MWARVQGEAMVAAISDPGNAWLIYLAAGGLVLIGALLTWFTVRWWKGIRPEHPALAPLEVMGDRSWRKAGSLHRAMALDAVRPEGAARMELPEELPLRDDDMGDDAVADEFTDLRSDAEPAAPEAAVEPESVVEPEPADEAAAEPVVEAEAEPVPEAEPEPVVEAEPEPVAEAEPVVEAEPDAAGEAKPVVEAVGDPEPEVERVD